MKYRAPSRHLAAKSVAPVANIVVGSLIPSACGKCKKVTDHRVTRKIGAMPTSLECTVCSDSHAYRSPAASALAKQRRAAALANAKPVSAEDVWSRVMRGARGPEVVYSTSGRYAVGQRLSHSEFGVGVVTALGSGTVCTVTFEVGEKRMLMGWSARTDEVAGP